MLTRLLIRNIVLIEQCEIALARGLCVLTGETGAGKSILLDALGLVLGARSDARLVRHGAALASVTAEFDIEGQTGTQAALDALGLARADELIIRRTLSADGKTRCFVNDEAVSVAALKSLAETLIEIHGQHDGRGLLDAGTHRDLLDAYSELQAQAAEVAARYEAWRESARALEALNRAIEEAAREKDYLEHVEKELSDLNPAHGEEDQLATARTTMMQSEKLAETLNDAREEMDAGKGAGAMVSAAQRVLARSALNVGDKFVAVLEALERAGEGIAEAENQLEKLARATDYDANALERIEERLFALRGMARKHHVTADGLATLLAETKAKLARLQNEQHQRAALMQATEAAKAVFLSRAEALSGARSIAARALEAGVLGELGSLKMAATQFSVVQTLHPEARWSAGGVDQIQFEAATNKGAPLSPLHKIASGGELSRFMLAMKVGLARVKSTPTLIFDEIDTGTGGAVADAIGKRLAALGETHQVLVVTHLPQVAARGSQHLQVMKEELEGATFTRVESLPPKARKEELARMLAGAEVTAEARKAAEKLLQMG